MPLPWLPAAIAGVSSLASTFLGSRTQKKNVQMTNRANLALAEREFQQNKEMWQMMKEYNTPANQMKRFKEAGLNPHLIYGQGTPGNVQSFPRYNAPRQQFDFKPAVDPASAVSSALGAGLQTQEMEKKAFETASAEWTAGIKELDHAEAWRQNQRQSQFQGQWQQQGGAELMWQNYAANMTAQDRENAGKKLRNKYQSELNNLIEKGLTPGDAWKLRVGLKIMDALGVDTSDFANQLNNAMQNMDNQ